MNYNVIAYLVYLTLMVYIIVFAGRYFYINGRVFIISLFNNNTALADQVNRLLLVAYYLFNIGYTFIKLRHWQKITDTEQMFSSLAHNISVLVVILAVTHYCNMLLIYYLSKRKSNSITHKSYQL